MKVKQLIKELQKLNPEALVVMSSDGEGNSYRQMEDISSGYKFDKEEETVGLSELTPKLIEQGYCKEDLGRGKDCVIFW